MGLLDSDRSQEILLIIGDSFQGQNRKWFVTFFVVLVAILPLYFLVKITYYNLAISNYTPPAILGQVEQTPLEEIEKGFVQINANGYAGFVKVKNLNLDWGVPNLVYRTEVKSKDGTLLASATSESYILPASEKYLIVPRFNANQTPAQIDFTVINSKFVLKPEAFPIVNMEIQRNQLIPQATETLINAVLKNNSPFTITQVDLQALIYNDKNQIVGINYTNVNDLLSTELRSFQLVWPGTLSGSLHVQISPEINIFNKEILKPQGPVSPFDS